jgi:peroxiredoxin Q/BCP
MAENKGLKVGDKAPAFSLKNTEGKTVKLSDFKGKKLALYFYPKDMTPGCTKEACGFRDASGALLKNRAAVLGVSRDGLTAHQKFKGKYSLPFPLLSDEKATVSKAYGVYKQRNLYGRRSWGIERSTFVIDPDGIIKASFRKVKVDGHVDEVLAALAPRA